MPRFLFISRTALDLVVLSVAYWLAFLFRFEFQISGVILDAVRINWPFVLLVQYIGLALVGVPRMSWRYINMPDTTRLALAVGGSTVVLVALRLTMPMLNLSWAAIPFGVIAMSMALSFLGLVGVRAAWRLRKEAEGRRKRGNGEAACRVLLIGAGEAGVLVAREIANRPDLGLRAVGFIDDDPAKLGASIGGLPVVGSTDRLAEIAEQVRATRVLITIASASGPQIRRIADLCRAAGIDTKIIPGVYEIVGGKVNLSRIRDVAIEDLLGREPVALDEAIVGATIRSRVVLVTGAGGSIGSELCRIICRFGPQRLILVERSENSLFAIHGELTAAFPHVPIDPRVADICDVQRMTSIFAITRPALVVHAAAHKHVPMMEWNPGEAVKNNIGGSRTIADLSDQFGVERFVFVSTDKAVNPSSVMGATKRAVEIYLHAVAQVSSTRFVAVRFGNVLASAGSVIPIFREQILRGGPVTVTHPEMTRYFMTIPEASQLVLQASAMGEGGELFILDMGEPVRILDLARDLITLSGLRPDDDIEIRYSGIRQGEKLHEELTTDLEVITKTRHPKIFIGQIQARDTSDLMVRVDAVLAVAANGDGDAIRDALKHLVPEFQTPGARPTAKRVGMDTARTTSQRDVVAAAASAQPHKPVN